MKKAQMEVMGMLLVVVIIILAMLFAAKLFVFQDDPGTRPIFVNLQTAYNAGSAILTTTTDCNKKDIRDVLKICMQSPSYRDHAGNLKGQPIDCVESPPRYVDSCKYLNNTIAKMLDNSLRVWQKSYVLIINESGNNVVVNLSYRGCPGERESAFFPSPPSTVGGKDVAMIIYVC